MKTLGKIVGVIGLLTIIAFTGAIGENKGKFDVAIEEELIETTKQIKSQLPIMVDQETRLDTLMCLEKQMHYKYTMINASENELDKEAFLNNIKKSLIKNHCSNENPIKMLKMGVTYYYNYFDKNGVLIGTINIRKQNCGL
ncbi:MAG: hypothetical protein HQK63_07925 [Desulfamplus sp.]|nr:hypothetical protein [Desulfamplus sp.]